MFKVRMWEDVGALRVGCGGVGAVERVVGVDRCVPPPGQAKPDECLSLPKPPAPCPCPCPLPPGSAPTPALTHDAFLPLPPLTLLILHYSIFVFLPLSPFSFLPYFLASALLTSVPPPPPIWLLLFFLPYLQFNPFFPHSSSTKLIRIYLISYPRSSLPLLL